MSVFFSTPYSCQDACPPREACGGKWNAAQCYVNWHGNYPFTGGPLCNGCYYGGVKYLTRRIVASDHHDESALSWIWNGTSWDLVANGRHYAQTVDNTTTINPKSGCKASTGSETETGPTGDGGPPTGGNCTETTTRDIGSYPFDADCGGGVIIHTRPLDVWGQLDTDTCGVIRAMRDGCGNVFFAGGSAADLATMITAAGMAATVDPITATHLGFLATFDLSFVSATYPPDGPPPPEPGPGDPFFYCASTEVHISISVQVNLSGVHDFPAVLALGYGLLATYNLNHGWKNEMPGCISGEFGANSISTLMPLIHYNDTGCCSSGMAPIGTTEADCAGNETIIRTFVRGFGDTLTPLRWGAFVEFGSEVVTIQKWAMRQGGYKPRGWQIGSAKTWRFLRQIWTADYCTSAATFYCDEQTGAKDFAIFITPNGEGPTGHNFWFAASYTFTPERTTGNLWQSVVKDADADKYPGDCSGAPPNDPLVYIEPETCACNCPTAVVCGPPGLGACPFEPDYNWP